MLGTEAVHSACPYCGEVISLIVDCSTESQHYIEDCSVCCRPIEVFANCSADGSVEIELRTDAD